MHRTESPDNVANKYDETFPGTIIGGPAMNALQEEAAGVIEDAGLTLRTQATDAVANYKGQLTQAVRIVGQQTEPPTALTVATGSTALAPAAASSVYDLSGGNDDNEVVLSLLEAHAGKTLILYNSGSKFYIVNCGGSQKFRIFPGQSVRLYAYDTGSAVVWAPFGTPTNSYPAYVTAVRWNGGTTQVAGEIVVINDRHRRTSFLQIMGVDFTPAANAPSILLETSAGAALEGYMGPNGYVLDPSYFQIFVTIGGTLELCAFIWDGGDLKYSIVRINGTDFPSGTLCHIHPANFTFVNKDNAVGFI